VPIKNIFSFDRATSTHEIRGAIAQQLIARYDLAEPIPDHLAELLKQLAKHMDESENDSLKVPE
jgi:hypothetical protein